MVSKNSAIGRKICIIGCGGSGKSYLADVIGRRLYIEVTHLDRLFWLPGWKTRDKTEFDAMCEEIYLRDSFIIDGNFNRTMPRRIEVTDTVVWLDFSTLACVFGVLSRIVKNYGRVRPDMGDGCPERFDGEFLRWILTFRKKRRPDIVKLTDAARQNGKNVIVLKNRREVNEFLASI